MCQGFSHFSGCLHNFALAKLATNSTGVNIWYPKFSQKSSRMGIIASGVQTSSVGLKHSGSLSIRVTVQTFNSCTNRPDVNINDPRSLGIKATFSYEVIHAQETGWQPAVRACIRVGLLTH